MAKKFLDLLVFWLWAWAWDRSLRLDIDEICKRYGTGRAYAIFSGISFWAMFALGVVSLLK